MCLLAMNVNMFCILCTGIPEAGTWIQGKMVFLFVILLVQCIMVIHYDPWCMLQSVARGHQFNSVAAVPAKRRVWLGKQLLNILGLEDQGF